MGIMIEQNPVSVWGSVWFGGSGSPSTLGVSRHNLLYNVGAAPHSRLY